MSRQASALITLLIAIAPLFVTVPGLHA